MKTGRRNKTLTEKNKDKERCFASLCEEWKIEEKLINVKLPF